MTPEQIELSRNDATLTLAKQLLLTYINRALGQNENEAVPGIRFSLVLAKDQPNPAFDAKFEKENAYAVSVRGNSILFYAKTERGLLDAVVSYLEKDLHIRFYTSEIEYVPSFSSLPLPKNEIMNPVFSMRNYLTADTYSMNEDEATRISKETFMIKAHALGAFTPYDEEHGGLIPFYARGLFHNFHCYCPYEIYGKNHPEFFQPIEVNGHKMMTIDITNGIAEDGSLLRDGKVSVANIVIEEMKKDIRSHPSLRYISLTQEDGERYFDDEHNRAEEKKYRRSGMLIRFCNAIIREIHPWALKELGRDIKLVTFAYSYTAHAPVKKEGDHYVPLDPTVVCDPNLYVMLAFPCNGFYSYFSSKQCDQVKQTFAEWKGLASHYWFWGYDIDFANYSAYFDSFEHIAENVRGFQKNHIDYLLINGPYDTKYNWQCNLRAYLYRRLMWDPSLDQNALEKDYLEHVYGPAAKFVEAMMTLYHQNYESVARRGHDLYLDTWGTHVYPENLPVSVVEEALRLLEEGDKAIDEAPLSLHEKETYHRRLSAVKLSPLNVRYINFHAYYPTKGEAERQAAKEAYLQEAKKSGDTNAREYFSYAKYVDYVESEDYKIHPIRVREHLLTKHAEEKR